MHHERGNDRERASAGGRAHFIIFGTQKRMNDGDDDDVVVSNIVFTVFYGIVFDSIWPDVAVAAANEPQQHCPKMRSTNIKVEAMRIVQKEIFFCSSH